MRITDLLLLTSALVAASFAKPTENGCWSEKFNIPCCKSTTKVVRKTYDGEWGLEDGQWCSIGESTRPSDDVPPLPSAPSDLDSLVDPAADCDITDSITGDSLAKLAPFRMGVGLNGGSVSNYTPSSKKMMELINYQFNSMTYSNGMKSLFIMDQEESLKNLAEGKEEVAVNFSGVIDGLEFSAKNDLHIRGHVLVWHKQTPEWFFRKDFDETKEYVDRETIFKRLDSYMKNYFDFLNFNYPGVVDAVDVVNEAVEVLEGKYDNSTGWYTRTESYEGDENIWYNLVGPDYVKEAFRIARKYALPTTKLTYNDYDTWRTTPHDKTGAIIKLMKMLKEEDLVDVIGMESYITPGEPTPEEYGKAIERYADAGLEIQITEFTIYVTDGDDWLEKQTVHYREMFQTIIDAYKKGANISSFTVFGLQDGYRFYESDSTRTRLYDHDLQKKPNFQAIMDILKEYNAELDKEDDVETTGLGDDDGDDIIETPGIGEDIETLPAEDSGTDDEDVISTSGLEDDEDSADDDKEEGNDEKKEDEGEKSANDDNAEVNDDTEEGNNDEEATITGDLEDNEDSADENNEEGNDEKAEINDEKKEEDDDEKSTNDGKEDLKDDENSADDEIEEAKAPVSDANAPVKAKKKCVVRHK
uniref:Beta-xylanase n=1 Tax=Anaeromyces contortus TaxID=2170304 RepID=A0A2S1TZ77_9FUNG|nr:Glycosyl hydrolase family 10 [Anaeromyces contortus]